MSGRLVKVHLWSDIPGHKKLWVITPMSTGRTARAHANRGELVRHITGLASLEFVLKELRDFALIDRLDFHTHGSSGSLALGRDRLNYKTLQRFRNKNHDLIFNPGARLFFHGCNVSDGAWGELFLAEFGAIFLRTGGGRVGASTSVGFANPFGESTYHFWGDTVYAQVRAGGAVKLKNHTHLNKRHIEKLLDNLERSILPEVRRIYKGRDDWEAKRAKKAASKASAHLKTARRLFQSAGTGNGSFAKLNDAHFYGKKAEQQLQQAALLVDLNDRAYARVRELVSE